jgi:hypothetical protein
MWDNKEGGGNKKKAMINLFPHIYSDFNRGVMKKERQDDKRGAEQNEG